MKLGLETEDDLLTQNPNLEMEYIEKKNENDDLRRFTVSSYVCPSFSLRYNKNPKIEVHDLNKRPGVHHKLGSGLCHWVFDLIISISFN